MKYIFLLVSAKTIMAGKWCPDPYVLETLTHKPDIKDYYVCPKGEYKQDIKDFTCGADNEDLSPLSTQLDSENGKLHVVYNLKRQQAISRLDFRLYVSEETKDSKSCGQLYKSPEFFNVTRHATKYANLIWCDSEEKCPEKCSENVTVTFDYIYSSCYFINMAHCQKSKKLGDVSTCGEMYETKYEKERLADNVVQYGDKCKLAKNDGIIQLKLIEKNGRVAKYSKLNIEKQINSTSDIVIASCDINDNEITCNSMDESVTTSCNLTALESEEKLKNGVKKESIDCIFKNIAPGDYNFFFYYVDDRCSIDSIWTKSRFRKRPCQYYNSICTYIDNSTEENPQISTTDINDIGVPEYPKSSVPGIYFVIITLLITVMIIITIGLSVRHKSIMHKNGIKFKHLLKELFVNSSNDKAKLMNKSPIESPV